MSGLQLSDSDRDLLVRTVIGEAGNQPDVGQSAVAHVALNRLSAGSAGGYADNMRGVVLAPYQFEPWAARGSELMGIPQSSPLYQRAAGNVDAAISGAAPDPTQGMTHFFAPQAQAALGRSRPAWAQGDGMQIGDHVFFAPQGRVDRGGASNAIEAAMPARTVDNLRDALGYTGTQATAMPTSTKAKEPDSSFFTDLGIDPKGGTATVATNPSPTQNNTSAAPAGGSSFFTDLGITLSPTTGADNSRADRMAPAMGAALTDNTKPKGTGAYSTGMDQAAAVGIGALDGVPVAGPYLLEGAQRGGAAVRALARDIPYSEALAQVRGINAGVQADNPGLTTAGNVAGAVGSFGAGAAMGGAKLLGMAGRLPVQMAYGAGSGAAIGAADSGVRGENMLTGAAFGLGGGAIGPAAGHVAGAGVNKLIQGAQYMLPTGLRGTGISLAAGNMAAQLVAADDPAAIRSFFAQHGPLATLADAGPSSLGITGSLVSTPGAPKTVVTNMLTDRASGTVNRLTGDIDAALGPAPVPSQVRAGIEAQMDALGPDYRRAMSRGTAVDTSDLARRLESQYVDLRGDAQTAVRQVRDMLNIPGGRVNGNSVLDPSPNALLSTRQAIDGMLEGETNSKTIGALSQARQAVDAELTRAVPGIKDVDAKFQELARQRDALAAGPAILDSGRTAPRPQEVAQSFPASANPAGTLVGPSAAPLRTQQGVRGEIDRVVGTKANDLAALKSTLQGQGGWNTDKLSTVFGQEPVNRLVGAVDRENAFANTTQDVLRNSLTSSREAGREMLKETAPGSMNLLPATAAGVGMQLGKKAIVDPIVRAIMESPTAPRNLELAHITTAQGATRDEILAALTRLNQRRQLLETGGNMLTGTVSPVVNMLTRATAANPLVPRPAY